MTAIELDLDGPETSVPTQLRERPRRTALVPGPGDLLFSVGPYAVRRGLVRAPGAWIVEAVDPNQRPVLLQLVHLRPLAGAAERAVRSHVEQTILMRTTALLDEQDQTVLAHGGVDRVDGTRVLFWAMPLPAHVDRLANPLKHLDGLDHLLRAALSVTSRLMRRHELGRFEPLLTEHLFLIDARGAELLGVPVQVPLDWLASDMPSPRLAPEEVANATLTAAGDLWRLGQALSVLACAFEPLPEELRALLGRMTAQAASRIPRASELAVELDSVRRSIDGVAPGSGQATVAMTLALSQDAVTELMMRAMGDSTSVEAGAPVIMDAPVPPWAFFFEPEEFRSFEAMLAPLGPDLSDLERAELARLCRGHASDRWPLLVHAFFSVDEAQILAPEARDSRDSPDSESTVVDAPLDPVHDLEIDVAGVAETRFVTPLVYVPDWMPSSRRARDAISIEQSVDIMVPDLSEPELELVEVVEPAVRSRKRWVLGSLAGLAVLGAAALAAGLPGEPIVPLDLDRAVVLETGTPNAVIVGEDGTVLGTGPVSIAVPAYGETAVLIAAPNHRPERIVLPSGGMLRVTLSPLTGETCALDVPSGVTVDAIGEALDGDRRIRGAAVIRAQENGAMRASIVRCDGSTRIEAPSAAKVGLTIPGANAVLMDGSPLESDRTLVKAGFHRIVSRGRERWVPVFRALEMVP